MFFKSIVSEALNEMILGIKYIKASGSTEFAKISSLEKLSF